jgi:DnaJ-class molecular chaperone
MEVLYQIAKVTCPVCKGSGKLPVTREPKAESHGEETIGECPACHGKGEANKGE